MNSMAIGPMHYRAKEVTDQNGTRVTLETYLVIKVTPSGFWIASYWDAGYHTFEDLKRRKRLRWVSSTSTRRFAYPDYKDALYSLYRRKQRQVRLIRLQLRAAELVVAGYDAFKSLPAENFLHPQGVAVGVPERLSEWAKGAGMTHDSEDLIVWADGTMCFAYELHQMTHMSDDYKRIPYDSDEWKLAYAEYCR